MEYQDGDNQFKIRITQLMEHVADAALMRMFLLAFDVRVSQCGGVHPGQYTSGFNAFLKYQNRRLAAALGRKTE